jgi:hypothetical protein
VFYFYQAKAFSHSLVAKKVKNLSTGRGTWGSTSCFVCIRLYHLSASAFTHGAEGEEEEEEEERVCRSFLLREKTTLYTAPTRTNSAEVASIVLH